MSLPGRTLFRSLFLIFGGYLITSAIPDREKYPLQDFRSPLNIPLYLAGSFGELRTNHFHSGIDIKTFSMEGFPVFAVADGYISRIRVQAGGFGNALYITHPNGFISVYAHLKGYHDTITRYLRKIQYEKESFEQDLYLRPDEMKVKQGDTVAFTGNTGYSGGPHLHFELRDAATEEPINPILFGIPVIDSIPPEIERIAIYPLSPESSVNGHTTMQKFKVYGRDSAYSLSQAITVHGRIGFAIEVFDMHDSSWNKNGAYSIELKVDGERVYYHELERFSFAETRYINSHTDYADKLRHKTDLQKCFIDPNNKLRIYKDLVNRGIVYFTRDTLHKAEFIVKDVHGNTSTLPVSLRGSSTAFTPPVSVVKPKSVALFSPYRKNMYTDKNGFIIELPGKALYDSIPFQYSSSAPYKGCLSDVHHVHTYLTPLHTAATISLRADKVPDHLKEKALIASVSEAGGKAAVGGSYKFGFITASIRSFGSFAIVVDTVPPVIKPITISEGKNMQKNAGIMMKISDNLSGIRSYRGTIDGKWVLMEFDAKSNTLLHTFENPPDSATHRFSLVVTDMKGNSSKYEAGFKR